jgi:hypothetical protein
MMHVMDSTVSNLEFALVDVEILIIRHSSEERAPNT